MEGLNNLQNNTLSLIQSGLTNFKKSPTSRVTVPYVEARLENLETQWADFCETHKRIMMEISLQEYEKSSYYKNAIYDSTEEVYIDYKTSLKTSLMKLQSIPVNPVSKVTTVKTENAIRLPKISIPVFSGNYAEWTSFRDLFTSLVHNNNSLDNVQRLHYLKCHLSGEAEQLLRHIPITESNYTVCWDQLKKRYDNKKYLSNHILRRLMGLKSLQSESASAIRELLDTMSECLHALKNLGINVDSWDIIIIFIMSQKLDPESRKQWEAKANELSEDLPTLNSFKEFLEHKFRSLEFLDVKNKPKVNKSNVLHVVNSNDTKTVSSSSNANESNCQFCSGNHKIINCKQFAKENYSTRRDFVQTSRLCFNCLGSNHSVFLCRLSTRCRICKRKHHSLLHPNPISASTDNDSKSIDKGVVVSTATTSQDEGVNVVTCFSNIHSQVLLATALVETESRTGVKLRLRCLLDQGSQASFITESAVQMLGLRKISNKLTVSVVGGDSDSLVSKSAVNITLRSLYDPSFKVDVKANVLSKLTTFLPSKKVVMPLWPELVDLQLADPKFNVPSKVDLLLGAEVYGQILLEGLFKGPSGSPVAQNTKLGWILSGQIHSDSLNVSETSNHSTVISLHAQCNENELLKKFWELESDHFDTKRIFTEEEQKCEEFFEKTVSRDELGRYVVSLPFRDADPKCKYGNSKEIAARRLYLLEKRLSKDSELKEQYSKVMKEYVDLNHMELVPEDQCEKSDAVYLPHHAVVREDKTTTKVRVVFDASCRGSNGVSLNNDLMVGPTLQPDLRHIVMRWRKHPIPLVADIVKMYRQVKVSESDTDYQRVLWRDEENKIQNYRMLRVTFGTASAPYLAVRVLQQLAYDERSEFPDAIEKVLKDFYMDDLMTGCETITEGLKLYKNMNKMMNKGGFQLQKWDSSNKELLEKIGEENNETEGKLEIGTGKGDGIRKVLGLTWNNQTDEFGYTVQLPPEKTPVTKRKVISDISRLFDPLGWISPVIIKSKIFIQKLWISGIDWDQELPSHLLQEWVTYRNNLSQLAGFRIPRWIHTSRRDVLVELHGFSDASNDAFAAVVYARTVDKDNNVHVHLVTSKTKVSPIKQVSIPRLELCGAQLLAKLLLEVSETLCVSKDRIHAWTDSSVVLAWLSSHPSRWKTFVANRVSDILTILDRSNWSHVRSQDNPADCASRGVKPSELVDLKLWKEGPTWLHEEPINYSPLKQSNQDTDLEEKSKKVTSAAVIDKEDDLYTRFSSLRKLIRVMAFCRRFYQLTHSQNIKPNFPVWLTASELNQALDTCIRHYQSKYFKDEIDSLDKSKPVHRKSKLASLCPFLDDSRTLRVGGRLHKSQLTESRKHPILVPRSSHLANLIVAEAHEKTLHGGPQLMLNYIRTKYWIVDAKNLVKAFVRKCIICLRHSSRTNQPFMGQLPSARVKVSRPFHQSGVDYAGPIAIRTTKGRGHRATKGYICLFICMATRAVHLEAVSDMTSEAFLAAFKRFVARRGHCADLYSDNGTTFVGADRELQALLYEEKSSVAIDISEWLATNGTTWHRIPPHSPNFGGLWEAGIKSTKHHLKRIIGTSTLTFEEITTVLSQIESCLNSRPLSQLSDNTQDPFPLTSGHFLVGEPLLLAPDANYESSNIGSLRRWQLTQRMVQDFWRRWSQEYLTQFLQRYKWKQQTPEPKIGDVVLVKEDDLPPSRWLYGIITDKHTGSDKVTRVVSLRCKGTIIKRPVSKLCILPVCD